MRRKWQIQRQLQPMPDAERRWDRAYQHLLAWTRLEEPKEAPEPGPQTPKHEEMTNENNRYLRSGIDRAAGASANHTTADRTSSGLPDE
jgi:hypothetical protein